MTNRTKTWIGILMFFLLGAALVSVASVFAHGGDTSLIHACVRGNGSIRIVGANETCGNNETALDWNIQGPPGPPGSGSKQVVKEFIAAPGQIISAGNVVSLLNNGQVINGNGDWGTPAILSRGNEQSKPRAAMLSATQFVVAHRADTGFGIAAVGLVSGTTVTYGPEVVFHADGIDSLNIAELSSTQFVVAYREYLTSDLATVVGTVSGSTITFGPEIVFRAHASLSAITALSATQFAIVYQDGTALAVIGTISGNTVVFGAETVFPSAIGDVSVATLSATQFVVAYNRNSDPHGAAIIGNISGNTITFGPESAFPSAGGVYPSVTALSPTQFVISYRDDGAGLFTFAIVGTVSGDAVSFGPKNLFTTSTPWHASVTAISPTEFVIVYSDAPNFSYPGFGKAVIGKVHGGAIAFGTPFVFNFQSTVDMSLKVLSTTQFVIVYSDANVAVVVGPIPFGTTIGIAKSAASGGGSLPVIIGGVSDAHSSLTPGATYYEQPNGTLTTTFTGSPVGVAVSPSELLLKLGGQ